jgi:hypothetical protein
MVGVIKGRNGLIGFELELAELLGLWHNKYNTIYNLQMFYYLLRHCRWHV